MANYLTDTFYDQYLPIWYMGDWWHIQSYETRTECSSYYGGSLYRKIFTFINSHNENKTFSFLDEPRIEPYEYNGVKGYRIMAVNENSFGNYDKTKWLVIIGATTISFHENEYSADEAAKKLARERPGCNVYTAKLLSRSCTADVVTVKF